MCNKFLFSFLPIIEETLNFPLKIRMFYLAQLSHQDFCFDCPLLRWKVCRCEGMWAHIENSLTVVREVLARLA